MEENYNGQKWLKRCELVASRRLVIPSNRTVIGIAQALPTPIRMDGRRVLVVGLGRFGGGVGVTRWLVGQGAQVTVTDQAAADSLVESLDAIADLSLNLHIGTHSNLALDQFDLAVINPAVHKPTSGLFAEILRRKIPWTTEMNLFCERCPARVVGITGSFGKSTTCAMLAEVLEAVQAAGKASYSGVHLGGNIGRSLLGELHVMHPTDLVVLEMSNAQLEDISAIPWSPLLAAITNLFPQHLDRHGSFEAYVAAKLNLVRGRAADFPVIVGDVAADAEPWVRDAVGDMTRIIRVEHPTPPIQLSLLGRHNRINAACAWTIARTLGLPDELVRDALTEFRGLPHRLEMVRTVDGIRFINDSKSTAPTATISAVEAVAESNPRISGGTNHVGHRTDEATLIVIVGGQRKDVLLTECSNLLANVCRVVICCGESGPAMAAAVRNAMPADAADSVRVIETNDLDEAVAAAKRAARPGDVVLFSPGAPSFDGYVNFTQRGAHFVELVRAL